MLVGQKLEATTTIVENRLIRWHSIRDLLAVLSDSPTNGGFVSFVSNKSERAFFSTNPRPNSSPLCADWNPHSAILAVGWSSGSVTLTEPLSSKEREISTGLSASICSVQWNNENEAKLLIADSSGEFSVISVSNADSTKIVRSFRIAEEIPTFLRSKLIRRSTNPTQFGSNAENGDELAKLLAQNRRIHEQIDEINEAESIGLRSATITPVFLIATNRPALYILREGEEPQQIYLSDSPLKDLLPMGDRSYIVAIGENLMFYQLEIDGNAVNVKIKVKLSGRREAFRCTQIDKDTVALCYGEREIRIWDLQREDSAVFRINAEKGYNGNEQLTELSHSTKQDCLSAATSDGIIANWRRHRESYDLPLDQQWRLQSAFVVNIPVRPSSRIRKFQIKSFAWGPTNPTLAINSGDCLQIFRSQGMKSSLGEEFGLIQTGAQTLSLLRLIDPIECQDLHFEYVIVGFHINAAHFVTWSDTEVFVHEVHNEKESPMEIQQLSILKAAVSNAVAYSGLLLTVEKGQLFIRTLQGTLKRSFSFRDSDGEIEQIHLNGQYLVVGSTRGYLRLFAIEDGNLRPTFHSSSIGIENFERFSTIRVNSDGSRCSLTAIRKDEQLDNRLYVWDAEADSLGHFSFADGLTDQQHFELEDTKSERPKTTGFRRLEKNRFGMPNHLPTNHFWDQNDSRLLCCEASHVNADGSANLVLTLFVTADNGIQPQDLQANPIKSDALIGVCIPFVYFLKNPEVDEEDDITVERSLSRLLLRRTLREFVGISADDKTAIKAMVDFSYFLCIGQMDNAFRAIKFIKNEGVWDHMARMCVKTRRVDVALVCLGNMRNGRAAAAVRNSIRRNESIELQSACLAIQLDMLEEASAIYRSVGRFDLLNRLLQSQNRWAEAFEIAEKSDRIHLRNSHYNFAQYLESIGQFEKAIEHYEKAQTHQFEVPRMLAEDTKAVDLYVKRKRDRELYRWWARYLESVNDWEGARNFYKYSDDYLSVIRILCYEQQLEEAMETVERSDDRAAAFLLARHFEANGDVQKAVHFFTKASSYNMAIRLAREHRMDDKLASLALMAGGDELVDTARYYENIPGHADKAVMLYHKAGMIGRALDLAFRTQEFRSLDLISRDLNADSDPRVLERAAEFFSQNQQDRMAVVLLSYAKHFAAAVQLCREKNVIISDEIADLLTPPRTDPDRKTLLEEIARCCLQQGNYHFAAKKFTQSGNQLEAMRALLRSGDTPKIILFANTAKNKDIYRLAGNYLQTLEWRDDASLMRQIESSYMKASAFDSLALFYESCAQLEVDEFHDYEKALTALNESYRCWAKHNDSRSESKRQELKAEMDKIKEFKDIKTMYETDPGAALNRLIRLISEPQIDEKVRLGDIYALLIQHNFRRGNYKKAYQFIEEFRSKRSTAQIANYVDGEILDKIYQSVGVPRPSSTKFEVDKNDDVNTVEYSHALRRQLSDD